MEQKQKRPSGQSRFEQLMEELEDYRAEGTALTHWSSFVETLEVPMDLYPTLVTGRPELIALMQPRALSADEAKKLYVLVAGLIRTNQALRRHTERTGQLVHNWTGAFDTLMGVGRQIEAFAQFEPKPDTDVEEDGR